MRAAIPRPARPAPRAMHGPVAVRTGGGSLWIVHAGAPTATSARNGTEEAMRGGGAVWRCFAVVAMPAAAQLSRPAIGVDAERRRRMDAGGVRVRTRPIAIASWCSRPPIGSGRRRLTSLSKPGPGASPGARARRRGRSGDGADSTTRLTNDAGRMVGNVHAVNPGMVEPGATTPTVTSVTFGPDTTGCRFAPADARAGGDGEAIDPGDTQRSRRLRLPQLQL